MAVLLAAWGSGLFALPASADDAPVPECSDLTIVFARGSDQKLATATGHQSMAQAFFDQIGTRLKGYSINEYELGAAEQGGHRYRAVGISAILDLYRSYITRTMASLIKRISSPFGDSQSSEGSADLLELYRQAASEYRNSVVEGMGEFTHYLNDRGADCPDEIFLVGGYSQGAQVVRGGLSLLDKETRDRIAHVALFSDPTLHLPEGESPGSIANCRLGTPGGVSPWRRGTVGCSTSNGILNLDGFRLLRPGDPGPYVPSGIESRVGSWCEQTDGVCTGSVLDLVLGIHFDMEARRLHVPIHGVYSDSYFGEAASEATAAVRART